MAKKTTLKTETPKKISIEIIGPVAAKFHLSHNIGDIVEMDFNQATDLIDQGYAKQL